MLIQMVQNDTMDRRNIDQVQAPEIRFDHSLYVASQARPTRPRSIALVLGVLG